MKSLTKISQVEKLDQGQHKVSYELAKQIKELDDETSLILGIEAIYSDLNGRGEIRANAFKRSAPYHSGDRWLQRISDLKPLFNQAELMFEKREGYFNNFKQYTLNLDAERDFFYTVEIGQKMTLEQAQKEISNRDERRQRSIRWNIEQSKKMAEEKAFLDAKNEEARKKRAGWTKTLKVTESEIQLLGKVYIYKYVNGNVLSELFKDARILGFKAESLTNLRNSVATLASELRA